MADDKKEKKKDIPRGKDMTALTEAINVRFQSNVGMMATDACTDADKQYLYPTGILSLDKYLVMGGLLGGRIVNVWGHEGTGKTLTSLVIAATMQKQQVEVCPGNQEGVCRVAFLDAEGTFSPSMAKAIGVDVDKLMIFRSTPEKIMSGEDYFDVIKILIQNGIELIIADSAPAFVPSSRMDATIGQGQKATHAALMSEGLQQITPLLNGFKRSVIIFINQMRMKPMVMFGASQDHTGGEALKFYSSYSLEVKKSSDIIKKVLVGGGTYVDKRIGARIQAELCKNKTASIPVSPITYDMYFESAQDNKGTSYLPGVDLYKDMVDTAIASGVITQSSSWYYYGDLKGNGVDAIIELIRKAGPDMLQKIRSDVLAKK